MFISQRLSRKFLNGGTYVLLYDGKDSAGTPRLVIRKVKATWGKYDPYGNKGGVCFAALSDGTAHVGYELILGYNTGDDASIQGLILNHNSWYSNMPFSHWKCFLRATAQRLLDACPMNNARITADIISTPKYWYKDNWYGNIYDFVRLRDAIRMAKTETGDCIYIFRTSDGQRQCVASASGYCPP